MERIRRIENTNDFEIIQGPKNREFIRMLEEQPLDKRLSDEEIEILQKETIDILSNCINPIDNVGDVTGLAFGYVQSGKTMSFTNLTTLAADNGFKVIIYFAGIKNNLLTQTTNRLKKDLSIDMNPGNYRVFQNPLIENEMHVKISDRLKKRVPPTILITVLKTKKYITELQKIFSYPDLKNEFSRSGVLIIDDEADQASLNTVAYNNSKKEDWEEDEVSPTYNSIIQLKSSLPNHSYVQYTATPQGPLLINLNDLLSPKFHVVLTPGKKYTGGKTFFIDNKDLVVKIPDGEVYHPSHNPLDTPPNSLSESLMVFLISVSIQVNIFKKKRSLSMLIHADRTNDASRIFYRWVIKMIANWADLLSLDNLDPGKIEVLAEFNEAYRQATKRINSKPTFEEVIYEVEDVLRDTNTQLAIQKKGNREENEIDWSGPANIIIGAEKLNRGFTVEELAVTYMPRHTVGNPNADTMQQRCRFFGYKEDYLDSCRVYLPKSSINEYIEYVDHEEITRDKLKKTNDINSIVQSLILDAGQNPTRRNILTKNIYKERLKGWRQINALNHISENIEFVNKFIEKNSFKLFKDYNAKSRNHKFIKLPVEDAIEFISKFKFSGVPDIFRKNGTLALLNQGLRQKKIEYVYFFHMASDITGGRKRELKERNGSFKINNIWSGRQGDSYPGDRYMLMEDFICIQIHKIQLTSGYSRWTEKKLFTLGIYYPEELSKSIFSIVN